MTGLTPDITAVAVAGHGVLDLTFADGLRGRVAVLDRMRGPVFERARTQAGFAEARLDSESGTVVWPGGADLAPDTLYVRVKTGSWPGTEIAAQFFAFLAVLAGILISAGVVDEANDGGFGAKQAWLYATILTAGYMVSRGLAKAGSRQPYDEDRS